MAAATRRAGSADPEAAEGRARRSAARSSPKLRELVPLDRPAVAIDHHHDADADRHLDGADGDDEDGEDLRRVVVGPDETPEGDDVQSDRVQQELDAHQHHHGRALRDDGVDGDGEEDGADHEIGRERHDHVGPSPPAWWFAWPPSGAGEHLSSSRSGWERGSRKSASMGGGGAFTATRASRSRWSWCWPECAASTAPTMPIRMRKPAASKPTMYLSISSEPTWSAERGSGNADDTGQLGRSTSKPTITQPVATASQAAQARTGVTIDMSDMSMWPMPWLPPCAPCAWWSPPP